MVLLKKVGLCFVVGACLFTALTGCDHVQHYPRLSGRAESEGKVSGAPSRLVIDAGVIFVDEASYLCLPLVGRGITEASEIVSVLSSCECAVPSIVEFTGVDQHASFALRVDFLPEVGSGRRPVAAMQLAVEVVIHLRGNPDVIVEVRFLHTTTNRSEGKSGGFEEREND